MSYSKNEILLQVENVSKNYDVPILRDITFNVHNIVRPGLSQGQIVSLVGKSGSGKSTLFRILAALEEPNTGTVLRYDKSELDLPDTLEPVQEGDMGVVFQDSYIYTWRTVSQILIDAANRSVVNKGINLQEITDKLDISKLMSKYSNQLSGGQRQRVALAEQILNGGNFILLDEPFSGLDTLAIDKVTKMIVDISLTDEHKTIILVSHDLSNSLAISDEAFILAKEEGKEGATITAHIDLAAQGLAWQPDIKDNPLFRDLLKQVKSLL